MRIHLPLDPHHFLPQPTAGPSSSPLVSIGGNLVLIELQGELSWEGDKHNGVVGVLGFDRPVSYLRLQSATFLSLKADAALWLCRTSPLFTSDSITFFMARYQPCKSPTR